MLRLRAVGLVTAVIFVTGAVPASAADCSCPGNAQLDGWCEVHSLGYVAGLEIRTHLLFEALDAHGHEFSFTSHPCLECRRAGDDDGFCEAHRLGFVDGLAYYSRLTYLVAKARANGASASTCPECRATAAAGGWCEGCGGVGFVGPLAFRDRREFEDVTRELDLVHRADVVGERCEHCAVAMLRSSICPVCKLDYRAGDARPFVPRNPAGGKARARDN